MTQSKGAKFPSTAWFDTGTKASYTAIDRLSNVDITVTDKVQTIKSFCNCRKSLKIVITLTAADLNLAKQAISIIARFKELVIQ